MNDALSDGAYGGFGAVLNFELGEKSFEMRLDGVLAQ
jgi:hypothetical protein